VRDEGQARRRGSTDSSCLDLRSVAVALDLVGVRVLGHGREVGRLSVGVRPAPLTPVLESTTDVLDRVAERRQRQESRRVAWQPGTADEVGAGDLLAGAARAAR